MYTAVHKRQASDEALGVEVLQDAARRHLRRHLRAARIDCFQHQLGSLRLLVGVIDTYIHDSAEQSRGNAGGGCGGGAEWQPHRDGSTGQVALDRQAAATVGPATCAKRHTTFSRHNCRHARAPVKPLSCPARAFLYKPLGSRCSHSSSGT